MDKSMLHNTYLQQSSQALLEVGIVKQHVSAIDLGRFGSHQAWRWRVRQCPADAGEYIEECRWSIVDCLY